MNLLFKWTGFYMIGTSAMKEALHPAFLKRYKADFGFVELFFLIWNFDTNIHDSQDSRRRGKLSLYDISTTCTRFTDTETLAGLLLQECRLFI